MIDLTYIPERTALEFHNDRDSQNIRLIRGVPGSGKTVMCLLEMLLWAIDQPPGRDNVRRTRFAVIRATYPQLNSTTIKTYENWFSNELWPVKKSVPYTSLVKFGLNDGTVVNMEVIFLALEKDDDVKKLKSLELTGGFINEAFEVDRDVLTTLFERTGRYPSASLGAVCKRNGVWADTNSPHEDHWWAKDEANPPEGWKFYIQPAPLIRRRDSEGRTVGWDDNPLAENITNLGGGNLDKGYAYYRKQLPGLREDKIKVNIENKFGSIFTGMPVYNREWADEMVANKPIDVYSGEEVVIGIDTSGLNPSAVFVQAVMGGIVLLDEIVEFEISFDEFTDQYLVPLIARKYRGEQLIVVVDPSNPRNAKTGTTAQQDLLKKQLKTVVAPSNNPTVRISAVKHYLGRRNGVVVDPRMKWTINGFKGGYSFGQIPGSNGRLKEVPDKNKFAHVHDAIQYACLYLRQMNAIGTPPENILRQLRVGRVRRSMIA